ncbi:MAG: hypothetical protein K6U87_10285 [Firmicutes bacterium]|nr:hypothetical protein [Bacillota bacterium]
MPFRDRAGLWVVGLLATWTNFFLQIAVWEGAYFSHRIPLDALNYQLSVWPVLVDILILQASLLLTRQQIRSAETQTQMLQALTTIAEGLHASLQAEAERDARVERLLQALMALSQADAKDLDAILAWVRQQEGGGP